MRIPPARGHGYLPPGEFDIGERGFSLDERITVSANVDHLFYGQAISPWRTAASKWKPSSRRRHSHGLTVNGRFFSGIGYQNILHPCRDFLDPALVQSTLLGKSLAMDAAQISWVAPLPLFVEVGGEIGMPVEFPFEDSDSNKNGITGGTLFARVGGDIGLSHSYRIGGWYLTAENRLDEASILDLDERFGGASTLSGGHTRMWGLDFVYKWAPDGNPPIAFQAGRGWMQRRLDGELTTDLGGGSDSGAFEARQSGWYGRGLSVHAAVAHRVAPRPAGGRSYDLASNLAGLVAPADFTPRRWSACSTGILRIQRVRLQYNRDRAESGVTDDQIFLQYIFSLRPRGAKF